MITFAMSYWYELLYYKEIPSIYWMTLVSSTFLQVISTCTTIKFRMGSKFSQIRLQTVELAAIERLEKNNIYL